jgi:hypothetical protein
MAELQQAQQAALSTFSLGMGQQGAAPGGSSTPTFNAPLELQPINFSLPHNDAPPPLPVTTTTPANQGALEIPVLKPPPPPVTPPNPVLTAGLSGQGITEIPHTTGSGHKCVLDHLVGRRHAAERGGRGAGGCTLDRN